MKVFSLPFPLLVIVSCGMENISGGGELRYLPTNFLLCLGNSNIKSLLSI